jgi:hypothetical protein
MCCIGWSNGSTSQLTNVMGGPTHVPENVSLNPASPKEMKLAKEKRKYG